MFTRWLLLLPVLAACDGATQSAVGTRAEDDEPSAAGMRPSAVRPSAVRPSDGDASTPERRNDGAPGAGREAGASPTAGPVDCREDPPVAIYDCEFSRNAFRRVGQVFYGYCGDCHSPSTRGVDPTLENRTSHDSALPYIDLGALEDSPLVELVRAGHHCAPDCDELADLLLQALEDWQRRFVLREERLDELATAEQRFREAALSDYQWHAENGCYSCVTDTHNNALAVVSHGELVSLHLGEYGEPPSTPTDPAEALSWHTVPGMFDALRGAIERAPDQFEVTYDAELGYPESSQINYSDQDFDEEDYFAGSDFLNLSVGYCPSSAPFYADRALEATAACASKEDCGGCAPRPRLSAACESETDCVVVSCAEAEDACGEWGTCAPESPRALADGCVPFACSTADDCSCGSCVNGGCSASPGWCLELPATRRSAPPSP